MEAFILLAVLAVVVLVVGAIMGMTAHGRISRLEKQVKAMGNYIRANVDAKDAPDVSDIAAPVKAAPTDPIPQTERTARAAAKARAAEARLTAKTHPAKPSKPVKPVKPKRSFEEAMGAQWSVWVGGLALAIGAIFLIRFSIEAGVFTPRMRILMAGALGVALLGAGEYMRRRDGRLGKMLGAAQQAYVPGVLTAVGIIALLGAVYAAHALFGFIGPVLAFALLAGISLGALGLSLLHGPKMAGLGLAASLVTPFLIENDPPNFILLFGYLAIVGAAALTLAKKRNWEWLNIFTLFGLLGWTFVTIAAAKTSGSFIPWALFMAAIAAVNIWISKRHALDLARYQAKPYTWQHDPALAALWSAIASLIIIGAVDLSDFARLQFFVGIGIAAAAMVVGARWPHHRLHAIIGGGLGIALSLGLLIASGKDVSSHYLGMGIGGGFALCLLAIAAHYVTKATRIPRAIWAGIAGVFALGFASHLPYFIHSQMKPSQPVVFAIMGLGMALAIAYVWRKNKALQTAMSILAGTAAVAFIGAVWEIDVFYRPVMFAGAMAAAALIYRRAPIYGLRIIAPAFSGLVGLSALYLMGQGTEHVSTRVIANALWLHWAVPAVLAAATAWLLSRDKSDLWSEGLKGIALVFGALFTVYQIHHFMNGGDVTAGRFSLEEASLQVLTGLAVSLGGGLLGAKHLSKSSPRHAWLLPALAVIASIVTLGVFVFVVLLGKNPLFNGFVSVKGGVIFNTLLLAYLLPAIALAAIAYISRKTRPVAYVRLLAGLALISLMTYVTAMVRLGFKDGEKSLSIFRNWPDGMEMYAISAVWLILGIALLALGIKAKRKDVRLASAVVITLTVLKTFLIDMASLEGVLRAVSFMALGLVLIVIGRVYQRLLFSDKAELE